MPNSSGVRRWLRAILRWGIRIAVALLIVAGVVFLYVFRTALYDRFSLFPREEEAWQAIRNARQELPRRDGWTEFRGICHSHSLYSHDSAVPFPEILAAAKKSDISFVFMTDHCQEGVGDYSLQWKGLHDGVLFVRGFEMSYGYMPWGIPDGTKLLNATEPGALAKQIHDLGGYVFFAHTEEPRDWDLPELSGMEIYNIHSNLKKLPGKGDVYARLAPDMILSTRSYPEHVMRKIFERQTKILARWDEVNVTRKVVGIAGNDCHQNNGVIARYTDEGAFNLSKTSPGDTIAEWKLNAVTRLLLRACFGKLEPGKQLFRVDFDAYERSVRFVNTHVLAHELTEKEILGAITEGRVFIAFDMIADARGFKYLARAGGKTAVMGETIPLGSDTQLEAESPVPCRFTVVHDGVYGEKHEGGVFTLRLDKPGKYRLEAELNVMNEWIPWVYTNPIEVVAPKS